MEYTTQAAEIVLDENQLLKAVAKKKLKKKNKNKNGLGLSSCCFNKLLPQLQKSYHLCFKIFSHDLKKIQNYIII